MFTKFDVRKIFFKDKNMRANTGPKTIGGLKPLPQWHSPSAGPACNHAR